MQTICTEDMNHEAHEIEFVEVARDSEFERTEWFRCHDCSVTYARRDWTLVDGGERTRIGEVARFDDLRPGETVWFEDWPWPQTVAKVVTDGHTVTVYTEQGGTPYVGAWFAEVTRELVTA